MRQRRQHSSEHGFTAAVCHGMACGRHHGEATVNGLRGCVRRHPHGVLVSTGCLLGRVGCLARTAGRPGSLLLVQPCLADRTPLGPAVWIGPVATAEEVAAVCHWVDSGGLRSSALPTHLHFSAHVADRAATN